MSPIPRTHHSPCHSTETHMPLIAPPPPGSPQGLLDNLSWLSTSIMAWTIICFLALRLVGQYLGVTQRRFKTDLIVSEDAKTPQCLFALLSILLSQSLWMMISIIVLLLGLQLWPRYRYWKRCRTVGNRRFTILNDADTDTEIWHLENNQRPEGKTRNQSILNGYHRQTLHEPKFTTPKHHQPITTLPSATPFPLPRHSPSPPSSNPPNPPIFTTCLQQATLDHPTHFPLPTIRRHSYPPSSRDFQPPTTLPPFSPNRLAVPYATLSPLDVRSPHMMSDWRKDTVTKADGCRRHVLLAQG